MAFGRRRAFEFHLHTDFVIDILLGDLRQENIHVHAFARVDEQRHPAGIHALAVAVAGNVRKV